MTTGVVLHNNSLYPALRRFEEGGDMLADLPAEQAAEVGEFITGPCAN